MTDLRVIPLGGLGEIGMNCLALEQRGEIVVVDCGVTFPNADNGVDVIHPRFDYLLDNFERVRGVVITHGHEDHIGALPYLIDELDLPIWAPPHAMQLIRARLDEWRFDLPALRLHETRVGEAFSVGSFEFEPIRVTHSIADATALAIRTDAGVVIHTGDFKLDPSPSDGELTDEARLAELGAQGVRLLLSDSTNVDSPGAAASETDVGAALGDVVASATGRVVIGMFSSNVQRLLELGAVARRTKRHIVLLGRSVMNHVRAATAVGRLDWPSNLVVSPDVAAGMARRDVLVIASGTQAEPLAALARLANGTHPRMKLAPGDVVVMSSRIIPGNDRAVFDMYGDLLRGGIEVVSRVTHPGIHTSGHAHRDEQRRMIELVRPRAFIPVHGTLHHLRRHAALAASLGVADVTVIENGQSVVVPEDGPVSLGAEVPVGRVATFDHAEIGDDVLRERGQLGRAGILTVAFALDAEQRLLGQAEVGCLGVLTANDKDILARARRAVESAVGSARGGPEAIATAAKLAARKVVENQTGQKPQVIVQIVQGRSP